MSDEKIINYPLEIPFKDFMPGQVIQSGQFNDDMAEIEEKVNEVVEKHNTLTNETDNHISNKENPHEVTAHQVGTYSEEEINAYLEDIRNGGLYDKSIENRVLDDECIEARNIKNASITSIKVDSNFGSQINISKNIDITDRYTKKEVDDLLTQKVGEGTYSKEELNQMFEDVQAGQIVDGTIDATKLKDDVGKKLDISANPSITDRYTKAEVNVLIQENGLPRDWGGLDEIVQRQHYGELPIANVMTADEFVAPLTPVLDIDVKEVVEARGTYKSLNERLLNIEKSDTVISNLHNTEGFVNKIFDVCQTYTDNFNKFAYGNVYTAWDNTVQTVNGKYELDCSSFINLLIHGVTFYNSRYNGKGDNITNPLFFNNIDSYKYRLANQIAKYCVENGYAFVPKSLDEIRAGDIVFYSWKDFETNPEKYTQAQIDFHNNAFMKIDHVAMYLDRKNNEYHHTIQYEQYTPQFLYTVSEEYMNQTVLVARLPFANIQENDTRDMIVNGNIKKICENNIVIGTYYLSKKLEKGKLYSLAINGQINTDNCYYIVQDEQGNTIYSDYGRQNNFSGTMIAYFLYQGEGTDKIKILIGSSDTSITQRNGYVNWCSLYEGYKLTISTKQGTSISNIRELQLIDSIKNKFLEGYGYTNNLVEYDTHYLVTLNLSVDEDFTSSNVEIGSFDKLSKTQRIPCILISHDNIITSGAIQFRYNGEISIIKYNNTDTWRHAIASGIVIK